MAKDRDNHAGLHGGLLTDEDDSGWMSRIVAEEDEFDRKTMWRLGSWGAGTVGVIVVAIVVAKSPLAQRRDQLAAIEAQSQQVQWIARESQNNARQLGAAVEILNSDRDRLYARVSVLEQGLDTVTGSIARQSAAATLPPGAPSTAATSPAETSSAETSAPAKSGAPASADLPKIEPKESPPKIAPVAAMPASASPEKKSAAADRKEPVVTGALAPDPAAANAASTDAPAEKPVLRTAFGISLGNARSIEGLRGIWRAMLKSNGAELQNLQPVVAIKEGDDGLGMRLSLIAGPFSDAASAAKTCAALSETRHRCETAVYDGQRLAMQAESEQKPEPKTRQRRRRAAPEAAAEPPKRSSFSSIFSR